jgi:hypothetical protein
VNRHQSARASWTRRLWILVCAGIGVLAACGGGVGTGGTGAFASGPIDGFGSIIVNDVVYDDALARIEDDTGVARARTNLGLGTVVEIDSDAVRNDAATASRVRITSERIGRVDAKAANTLTVNGLPVRIDSGTVFDAAFGGGAGGITVGALIEVHGFATGTPGEVLATRIEPRSTATAFKFRAAISALDTVLRTFQIGNQTFAYAPGVGGGNELAEGAFVTVWVDTAPQGGRWVVQQVARGQSRQPDAMEVKAHGLITSFTSNDSFQVGPWTVNASGASIDNGPLALGLRVKVEGRVQNGVLVATEVKVQGGSPMDGMLQMRGVIAEVDNVARTFAFNGRRDRVSYAGSVTYENGTEAALTVGRRVTAYGRPSADGTLLEATRIRIEN